jgi:hypothetical protein
MQMENFYNINIYYKINLKIFMRFSQNIGKFVEFAFETQNFL